MAEARYARLEAWARERFPMMQTVDFQWSGQVMESVDGIAFIGRNPGDADNVYIATGDSGMGMTHGTIAGTLDYRSYHGPRLRSGPSLYDPSRQPVRAAGAFVRESLNVVAQYADWMTGGDVETEHENSRKIGSGAQEGTHENRGLPGRGRSPSHMLRRLPASQLHRGLEPFRKNMGLPLPRLSLRQIWKSPQWAGHERSKPA